MNDDELENRLRRIERSTRAAERRRRAFGEKLALYSYTFENDSGSVPKTEEARRYLDGWQEMKKSGTGLLFWGEPGTGKTFAAACIANGLCAQGFEVRLTTLGAVLTRLPGLSAAEKEAYMQDLICCDLLIIDDFGMERRTEYAQEQIFSLIDGRYLSGRPMIVTTNLSVSALSANGDIMHRRLCGRILEMCVPVYFDGADMRRAAGKRRLDEYVRLTRGKRPNPLRP